MAFIASLWNDKVGAAEFDLSRILADAIDTRLGRGADGLVVVVIAIYVCTDDQAHPNF